LREKVPYKVNQNSYATLNSNIENETVQQMMSWGSYGTSQTRPCPGEPLYTQKKRIMN